MMTTLQGQNSINKHPLTYIPKGGVTYISRPTYASAAPSAAAQRRAGTARASSGALGGGGALALALAGGGGLLALVGSQKLFVRRARAAHGPLHRDVGERPGSGGVAAVLTPPED